MLTAQAATIATLTAENARLKHENDMLKAQATIDTARINRPIGNLPVPPRRVWASL